jgi:type IV secretory pathway ATPase VirB11/archaellum biosynthesis ATPase
MLKREELIDFLNVLIQSCEMGYPVSEGFGMAARITEGELKEACLTVAGTCPEEGLEGSLCEFANRFSCEPLHRTIRYFLVSTHAGFSPLEGLRVVREDLRSASPGSVLEKKPIPPLVPIPSKPVSDSPRETFSLSEETRSLLRALDPLQAAHWGSARDSLLEDARRVFFFRDSPLTPEHRTAWGKLLSTELNAWFAESPNSRSGSRANQDQMIKEVLDLLMGLGPLEDLLLDPEVSSIHVPGTAEIRIQRSGKEVSLNSRFSSEHELMNVIERLIIPDGLRVDEKQPLLSAHLSNGHHLTLTLPPISSSPRIHLKKAVRGSKLKLPPTFLQALKKRGNIVLFGADSNSRAAVLDAVLTRLPSPASIVLLESNHSTPLPPQAANLLRLRTRPPNIENEGEILLRDLLAAARSIEPDWIFHDGGFENDLLMTLLERKGVFLSLPAGNVKSARELLKPHSIGIDGAFFADRTGIRVLK